ncbi:hypothetical protein EKO27_g7056 [Xylaria grammica]|uniref:2-methylcitrate dehydratase n=1 Tax=Xylaria grammica TaxID=363999 RepID=A0A439D1E4_9PEZI|nr:hypothetical protein EKO27_g7056 [Xylaria grammica]
MHIPQPDDNSVRPYDDVIIRIVDYAYDYEVVSEPALARAKMALIDSLGVAIESLALSNECASLVKPLLPGAGSVAGGFKLPGTPYSMDVLQAAFNMGAMIRYLDHNDAFAGAEWGHPSDNLGAILVIADVLTRDALARGKEDEVITMKQVLVGLIKAYEIQGCFQVKNAFNRVGLDHTILVKIGSTAVVSWLMGLTREQALSAVSHAWVDGHPLRKRVRAPAAIRHLGGGERHLQSPYRRRPRPHGVEATMEASKKLQERGLDPIQDIKSIHVRTQEAAMIIINKKGPLHNAADRDHCLRYIMAVVLLKNGVEVETEDYQDDSPFAKDPRVEALRSIITMEEDVQFTKDYHNPEIRSVGCSIEFFLKDGTSFTTRLEFPLGHPARNAESFPMVRKKAIRNLELKLPKDGVAQIIETLDQPGFDALPASKFIDLFQG